ncbi:hypothetical protein DRJ25_00470 [Candidatus Woesearchaeota archaeon]|nr:MAG: hypothetical protein DRJ25_00470 [Candidatus Woesearchaeota archaeon]
MVTLFDSGILQKLNFLFPFLLVLVFVYVVLTRLDYFKDKQGTAGFIAFVLAILTITSSFVTKVINKMAPWFILLIVFGILILLVYQAMGIKEDKITEVLTSEQHGPAFVWLIIALVVLIALGSIITVFSEEKGFLKLTGKEVGSEEASLWSTLIHPKLLGLVLLLLVAYFSVQKLTSVK